MNLIHPGQCDIAVEEYLALHPRSGKRCGGVWTGPVKKAWGLPSTNWRCDALKRPIHVWIETPKGLVIDPTRWVFEGVWPYLYRGPRDHYDLAVSPIDEGWRGDMP